MTLAPGLRLAGGLLAVLIATACGSSAAPHAQRTPAPTPVVEVRGAAAGRVPWSEPLSLSATDGTLRAVEVHDPDGAPLAGRLQDGQWVSGGTLLPDASYAVTATVADRDGRSHRDAMTVRTAPPVHRLHALLQPRDGTVVGVGLPVIVMLDQPVTDAADRAAVLQRLTVTTSPVVAGAWRWMSPTELHYRGPTYWAKGTTITVTSDFARLPLTGGTWGEGTARTTYSVGSAVISTVDVTAHTMTVTRDGVLLRTLKVSTGRDKYPTKNGVHLVLEKTKLKIMDSATVGIPRTSPDGYYEKVPFSVRISYGGAFVHAASWSVRDQGLRNVSHGCVNLSPSDAEWFYGIARRGDVVDVLHSTAPPLLSDPGTSDWNIPFAQWAS